jgi:hypothetical protein
VRRVVTYLNQGKQIFLRRLFEARFLIRNHRGGEIGQADRYWIATTILLRLLIPAFVLGHLVQGLDSFAMVRQPFAFNSNSQAFVISNENASSL